MPRGEARKLVPTTKRFPMAFRFDEETVKRIEWMKENGPYTKTAAVEEAIRRMAKEMGYR